MGAVSLTVGCFLVLPVIQAIANQAKPDLLLQEVDSAVLPPPPPPPEPEPEPEPEEQDEPEPPPELDDGPPPDLSTLEMTLGPGGGFAGPEIEISFGFDDKKDQNTDDLFNLSQLDQVPRVRYAADPILDRKASRLVKKQAHEVYLKFIVDAEGRVQNPRVDSSTHPAFEGIALKAIKKWRFDPGKANGKAVSFRMRLPITFAQSQ